MHIQSHANQQNTSCTGTTLGSTATLRPSTVPVGWAAVPPPLAEGGGALWVGRGASGAGGGRARIAEAAAFSSSASSSHRLRSDLIGSSSAPSDAALSIRSVPTTPLRPPTAPINNVNVSPTRTGIGAPLHRRPPHNNNSILNSSAQSTLRAGSTPPVHGGIGRGGIGEILVPSAASISTPLASSPFPFLPPRQLDNNVRPSSASAEDGEGERGVEDAEAEEDGVGDGSDCTNQGGAGGCPDTGGYRSVGGGPFSASTLSISLAFDGGGVQKDVGSRRPQTSSSTAATDHRPFHEGFEGAPLSSSVSASPQTAAFASSSSSLQQLSDHHHHHRRSLQFEEHSRAVLAADRDRHRQQLDKAWQRAERLETALAAAQSQAAGLRAALGVVGAESEGRLLIVMEERGAFAAAVGAFASTIAAEAVRRGVTQQSSPSSHLPLSPQSAAPPPPPHPHLQQQQQSQHQHRIAVKDSHIMRLLKATQDRLAALEALVATMPLPVRALSEAEAARRAAEEGGAGERDFGSGGGFDGLFYSPIAAFGSGAIGNSSNASNDRSGGSSASLDFWYLQLSQLATAVYEILPPTAAAPPLPPPSLPSPSVAAAAAAMGKVVGGDVGQQMSGLAQRPATVGGVGMSGGPAAQSGNGRAGQKGGSGRAKRRAGSARPL